MQVVPFQLWPASHGVVNIGTFPSGERPAYTDASAQIWPTAGVPAHGSIVVVTDQTAEEVTPIVTEAVTKVAEVTEEESLMAIVSPAENPPTGVFENTPPLREMARQPELQVAVKL